MAVVWMLSRTNRNNFLANKGLALPKATSTGTTIVGCLFKDGIVLGADTRATEGEIVADKNCEKVRAPAAWKHKAMLLTACASDRSTTSPTTSDAAARGQLRTPSL